MTFANLRRCIDSGRMILALACLSLTMQAAAVTGPGTFVVDTNADTSDMTKGDGACDDGTGHCSLRAAIEEGNALDGATRASPHAITFGVPEVDITNGSFPPATAPFLITGPVYINGGGLTCLGFSESGQIGTSYVANGADGSKIIGIAIGNCGSDAIDIGGHGYTLTGNFIGVDLLGVGKPNNGHGIEMSSTHVYGVFFDQTYLDTIFGKISSQLPVQGSDVNTFLQNMVTLFTAMDPTTISGNVISANTGNGVNLHSVNLGAVFVTGNWIGTDPTGKIAMPNGGNGVDLNGSTFADLIVGNVISGNTGNGVSLSGTVLLPNFVMNNVIGPPAAVATPAAHIGNGKSGVYATMAPETQTTNKNVSGVAAIVGPGNFISDNQGAPNSTDPDVLPTGGAGVYVTGTANGVKVTGNTIGMVEVPLGTPQQTNAYGNAGDGVIMTANGNTVSNNVIAGNKRHGILVNSTGAISNHITGNTIGRYPAFASDKSLGNGFDGIHIDDGSSTAVGGPNAGDGNTIVFNGRNGVKILNGGANDGWGNLVQANTIYGNAQGNPNAQPSALPSGVGVGIDLDVVANASDGPHGETIGGSYANLNQTPPVICVGAVGEQAECSGYHKPSSAGGTTTLDWTIATHGVAKFHAEFYKIDTSDDNTATGIVLLGTQDIGTTASGVPDPAPGGALTPCPGGRCTVNLSGGAAGAYVLMTITDISDLLSTPGASGWQTNLKCFFGDNGVILPACLANDTSEFSNVAAVVSSDASLSNLVPSVGSLTPAFLAGTLAYTDAVSSATPSITLTATTADANATVTVAGNPVTSGSASLPITLNPGPNSIDVVVTAQDNTTIKTYTVTVTQAAALSNNANLGNLTISSGSLVPAFAPATIGYTDSVSSATASVMLTPTTADANAKVTVAGNPVTSGSASLPIALNPGPNAISVVVTAQDNTTIKTYTVTVTRAAALSNNANLSNLAVSVGSLSPGFAASTLIYTDAVSNATASVTVTPTTADVNAKVTVAGNPVTSGSASLPIALNSGANAINVVVTAQDNTTIKTYTVTVNRAVTLFSGTTFTNTGVATALLSGGGPTCSFASASLVGPPAANPPNVTFPDGMFQFTTSGCAGTITVTVTFPTAFLATENYWKFGPTPGPVAAHWYPLDATNNVNLTGSTATFTITDGGLGDDDLTVNGTIIDAGGPGVGTTPVTLQDFTVD